MKRQMSCEQALNMLGPSGYRKPRTPEQFIAAVRTGEAHSYRHGNESGTLWEKLWRVFEGSLQSKVCASGVFDDWRTYESDTEALGVVRQDFELIYGRLFREDSCQS